MKHIRQHINTELDQLLQQAQSPTKKRESHPNPDTLPNRSNSLINIYAD